MKNNNQANQNSKKIKFEFYKLVEKVGTMFQQLKIWHLKAWTKKKKKNLNQP
jgi:hypothetical protein